MSSNDDAGDPLAPTGVADAAITPTNSTIASDIGGAPTGVADATQPTTGAPLAGRVDALTIVDRAHYESLGEFGRGGLGRVIRARDRRTGRIVAIKEALRSTPGLLARFAREAIVTANLQHPAIVPVYEVGRWASGEPFYAMKLVAGRSLADAARRATTLRDRLALLPHVIAVADALAYAHGERVIHRDLKPANVLIGDYGETVVIDWGLAKRLGDADDLGPDPTELRDGETMIGTVLGTPGYMAPEQARGELVDEHVDVYAIGAMLYEVLSRVRPYHDSEKVSDVVDRQATEPPQPLATIDPQIPRELVAIVERAMAFDPAARYRTAKELAEDLKRFQTGQLVGAHSYTAWMLIRRWIWRHRGVVAVAGAALIVLAIVAAVGVTGIRRARDRAVIARALAEDRAAALAEEQGRQLTVAGDPPRGLPFLADAIARGRQSPALRFVLARALDRIASAEAVLGAATAPVNEVSYSPDGNELVASGADLRVRIWDPHTHKLLRTIGTGTLAAWSPDGSYIAVLDASGGSLELHDPGTGAVNARFAAPKDDGFETITISHGGGVIAVGGVHGTVAWFSRDARAPISIRPHTATVIALAFSPDDRTLAIASLDHTATIWNVADGTKLATLNLADPVRDIAFSPDGKRVITGSVDATVIVWDAETGAKLQALSGHTDSVESVRYDASGVHILTGSSDHSVVIWDAHTGARLVALDAANPVREATFSPDGRMIVAFTEHGDIHLWTSTGAPLEVFAGHNGSIADAEFSPDGKQLASAGLDGDVRLWRLDTAHPVVSLDHGGSAAWRGTFSPDGKWIAITAKDGIAREYDGMTGALVHELRGHAQEVTFVAFSPDSSQIATASADGTARLWTTSSGAAIATIDAGAKRVRFVGYSHDGATLATTHDDGTVRLWNAATHAPGAVLTPPDGKARRVVWSPDGRRLLVPLDGHGAVLWDASGRLLGQAPMSADFVMGAAWRPDGAQFTLGASTREINVYDGATAKQTGELIGHTLGPIATVEYAPDGVTVATTGGDGLVRLWTGSHQKLVVGDGDYPTMGASFRPDGALIATAGIDIQVWDTVTGALVGVLVGERQVTNAGATELHWSPDGTRLLVMSLARPPRLWRVPEWRGTSDELAQRLRCTLRWRLEDARLVATAPDATACVSSRPRRPDR